uniref:AlNc14C105G6188 protein n=1 Tax=Albugo laibachii Nc14 TaxID=890382 RepID=F0WHY1_9STRA|nr:AlNc14C105G6188 [Albugo laibachii Nc14]|eukprot:CCA20858.1 AlNc14C105G6188 [Albugo laibachii Nc14]
MASSPRSPTSNSFTSGSVMQQVLRLELDSSTPMSVDEALSLLSQLLPESLDIPFSKTDLIQGLESACWKEIGVARSKSKADPTSSTRISYQQLLIGMQKRYKQAQTELNASELQLSETIQESNLVSDQIRSLEQALALHTTRLETKADTTLHRRKELRTLACKDLQHSIDCLNELESDLKKQISIAVMKDARGTPSNEITEDTQHFDPNTNADNNRLKASISATEKLNEILRVAIAALKPIIQSRTETLFDHYESIRKYKAGITDTKAEIQRLEEGMKVPKECHTPRPSWKVADEYANVLKSGDIRENVLLNLDTDAINQRDGSSARLFLSSESSTTDKVAQLVKNLVQARAKFYLRDAIKAEKLTLESIQAEIERTKSNVQIIERKRLEYQGEANFSQSLYR